MGGSSDKHHGSEAVEKTEQNSLRELYSFNEGVEIDIVAVHGLNPKNNPNHAKGTWTAPNGKLWLRDFLPEIIPSARILLFSYDSGIAFRTTAASLADQANSLLERLLNERMECSERPIVFVCHSLGGLLVKQAIVNARRNHRVYGSIPEATYVETSESKAQFIDGERYGIAFFGTPHRGGNGASLGKVVASIIRRTLWNPANDFMSFLRKDSRLANDLTEEFRHDLEDYYYLSFFETIPMGMMIVDKASATLGMAGTREKELPLRANHSQMCKFTSPTDANYELVAKNLKDLAERAIASRKKNPGPEIELSGFSIYGVLPKWPAVSAPGSYLQRAHGALAATSLQTHPNLSEMQNTTDNFTLEMFRELIDLYLAMDDSTERPRKPIVKKNSLLDLKPFTGYSFMSSETRMYGRALCMGCALDDRGLVRRFLTSGVDVHFQDYIRDWDWANHFFSHLLPPLLTAAIFGHVKMVDLLLSCGATANDIDEATGLTALHVVAYRGNVHMGRCLIDRGAIIDSRDYKGRTPLHCATYGDSRRGGKRQANMAMLKLLLEKGAAVEAIDNFGATPLHISVYTYQEEATEYLLKHGASVYTKRGDGTTVVDYLHRQSLKIWWFIDTEEIFCTLLKHGAFQNCEEGSTPLHDVVKHQNGVYVKIFLGLTPLHTSSFFNPEPADPDFKTEFPALAAIDINTKDNYLRTPLHYASLGSRPDIVDTLLDNGADPNATDSCGNTPLHYACSTLSLESVVPLLKKNAHAYAPNRWGDTALHLMAPLTAQSLFEAAVEYAFSTEGDDELVYPDDWEEKKAELLAEIEKEIEEAQDLLLDKSLEPQTNPSPNFALDRVNEFMKETALHIAADYGNAVFAKKLLDRGANPRLEDIGRCTPIDIAMYAKHTEMVSLLQAAGCTPTENWEAKCEERNVCKDREMLRRQEIDPPRWKPKKPFKREPTF